MRGDVANLPVLLRKPGQLPNPRFVAWPLELGLGTRNPRHGKAQLFSVEAWQGIAHLGQGTTSHTLRIL